MDAIDGDEGDRSFDIENGWPLGLRPTDIRWQLVARIELNAGILSQTGAYGAIAHRGRA